MDDGSRLPWIIAIILLFCAMYFAVTETAMASASRTRIKTAADRGDTRAKDALFLLDNFDRAITTILIGTNIVHIAVASIVTVAVTRRWGLSVVTLSTIVTTIAVFFLGEMLPKSLGKEYSEKLLFSCAGPMRMLMKLFAPLSALLTAIGRGAAKLSKGDPEITVTEDELYDIIEDMTEEGSLDEEQGELISSALQFGDVTVESILTPRVDVTAIDVDDPLEEILQLVREQNHSRLPAYEGTIDNVVGVLQIRKFIKAYLHLGERTEIRPLLDEPFFIHQSTNIDELLPIMSKGKKNMAIVTDNYGGTRTTWSKSRSPTSAAASSASTRRRPSATCSSTWALRTPRRTRSWSTRRWASGPMSSSPPSRMWARASATTTSPSRSTKWSITASSS